MGRRTDVVVVGAGLMGAATAWAAATRGLSVTVVDQFAEDHRWGSSHGSARIVRRGYGEAFYTDLAGRALELWAELEQQSGTALLRRLGGIDFGRRRRPEVVAAHLAAAGVPHAVLDPVEAARRWPGMTFDGPVVFHEQAGTVDAAAAVRALLAQAQRHGAHVRRPVAVDSLHLDTGSASVTLSDGEVLAASVVVVAAGAWVERLVPPGIALPALRITRQSVFHFPRVEAAAPAWPSVIHEDTAGSFYHLAGGRDGGPGDDRKIGQHDLGLPVTSDPDSWPSDADSGPATVDPAARQRVVEYVRRWLPGLEPTPRGETTCLYTSTPSEDFIIDRRGPLVVCSPCSGHGAKFAPVIGELVAGLVTGSAGVPDRFRLAAHALAAGGRTVSL